MKNNKYKINKKYLNNPHNIERRLNNNSECPLRFQPQLKDVLEYIYLASSNNCSKSKLRKVERYLDIEEIYLSNWLTNKTNDTKGKVAFGPNAIIEAKEALYKCRECSQNDVRTLEIDHVDGDRSNKARGNFKCLCGSCHNIKTRTDGLNKRVNKMSNPSKKEIKMKMFSK